MNAAVVISSYVMIWYH